MGCFGERETRNHVWVTTDFLRRAFGRRLQRRHDSAIEDDATSTARPSIEVCGTTEAHAEVKLENTDTGGVVQRRLKAALTRMEPLSDR